MHPEKSCNITPQCSSCKIKDLQIYKNLINSNCVYYCNTATVIQARVKRNYLLSLR